jgi:hypothetical protein
MSMLQQLAFAAGVMLPTHAAGVELGNNGLEGTILNRFMAVATCSPCVQLGDHIGMCMDFSPVWGTPVSEVAPNSLVTWVPKNRVAIILIALGNNCTAVWVAETGKFYYATDTISLPPAVPAGTVLLANYTEDGKETYRQPRVLVYDVAAWGSASVGDDSLPDSYSYDNMRSVSPEDRYRKLREDFDPLLKCDKFNVPVQSQSNNTIVLQWVGFKQGAQHFLDGRVVVGHDVETLLKLSEVDALMPELLDC